MVYVIAYDQRIVITLQVLIILFILKLSMAFLKALCQFGQPTVCWSAILCA